MAEFDSYIKNLGKVKERREKLAQHIKYNCEHTKKLKDWQLPIYIKNKGEYLVRISELNRLADKSLLEDPAFKKLFDIFNNLYKLCDEHRLIWRCDLPSENQNRLRLDSKIRLFDGNLETLMEDILNRRMKENEYTSILDESHKLYSFSFILRFRIS